MYVLSPGYHHVRLFIHNFIQCAKIVPYFSSAETGALSAFLLELCIRSICKSDMARFKNEKLHPIKRKEKTIDIYFFLLLSKQMCFVIVLYIFYIIILLVCLYESNYSEMSFFVIFS